MMRVEVAVHQSVEPVLAAWRETLGATQAERGERFAELWSEFTQGILAAGGPPSGSMEVTTEAPPSWWCDFPGGGLARVIVEIDHRLLVFERRRVVVTELVFSPGFRD